MWAEVLLDELRPLGFDQSYATLTRQLRMRGLRPISTTGLLSTRALVLYPDDTDVGRGPCDSPAYEAVDGADRDAVEVVAPAARAV